MTKQLESLSRVGQQLWQRYGSPLKHANALRLQELRHASAEVLDAYPWRLILDPHAGCNLRCTDCGAHTGSLPRGPLDPQQVEHYLRNLLPYLVQVNLFHWGEPFLNPRIDEIVATIHRHGVGTQIHSNMNYVPEGAPERVIAAGLDFFVASIDGITQETYAHYRRRGQVDMALANLRRFVQAKRKANASNPKIIWRYLCFSHTLKELDGARELAAEIGVDEFAVGEGCIDNQRWTQDGPKSIWQAKGQEKYPLCETLYDFPVIHSNGQVLPCCYVSDPSFLWGDLNHQTWLEAINTEPFRMARRYSGGHRDITTPCKGCTKLAALDAPEQACAA